MTEGSFSMELLPLLRTLLLAGGVLGVPGPNCPTSLSLGGSLYQSTGAGGMAALLCRLEEGRGGGRGCLYRKEGGVEGVSYCIPYSPAPSSSCCASQVPTSSQKCQGVGRAGYQHGPSSPLIDQPRPSNLQVWCETSRPRGNSWRRGS